jgi:hypothetical protein
LMKRGRGGGHDDGNFVPARGVIYGCRRKLAGGVD